MCTGQLLATAVFMVVWIAVVSSCVPSPMAPLHLMSIHGRPEHISTSPFRVAAPVVESVEKLPGDCARAGVRGQAPEIRKAIRLTVDVTRYVSRIPVCSRSLTPGFDKRDAL